MDGKSETLFYWRLFYLIDGKNYLRWKIFEEDKKSIMSLHHWLHFRFDIFKFRKFEIIVFNFLSSILRFFSFHLYFYFWNFFVVFFNYSQYGFSFLPKFKLFFSICIANDIFNRSWRPIRYSISKLLIRNVNTIEFLSLFDFNFNLVIFSILSNVLDRWTCTLEFRKPFFSPSRFIEIKFFPPCLDFEPDPSSHLLITKNFHRKYLLLHLLYLSEELFHMYDCQVEVNENLSSLPQVLSLSTNNYFAF